MDARDHLATLRVLGLDARLENINRLEPAEAVTILGTEQAIDDNMVRQGEVLLNK